MLKIWEGKWGEWSEVVNSQGKDWFACGACLRVQPKQGRTADDTAANGLDMVFCNKNSWFEQKSKIIEEGEQGNWGPYMFCPINFFVTGA